MLATNETRQEVKTCRICLGNESDDEGFINGEYIAPCACRGTSKWVHRKCLDLWRVTGATSNAMCFTHCPTCKFEYRLRHLPLLNGEQNRYKSYYREVNKRFCLLFLGFVLMVMVLTVGTGLVDTYVLELALYKAFPRHLENAVEVKLSYRMGPYLLYGFAEFFAIVGILVVGYGSRWCCTGQGPPDLAELLAQENENRGHVFNTGNDSNNVTGNSDSSDLGNTDSINPTYASSVSENYSRAQQEPVYYSYETYDNIGGEYWQHTQRRALPRRRGVVVVDHYRRADCCDGVFVSCRCLECCSYSSDGCCCADMCEGCGQGCRDCHCPRCEGRDCGRCDCPNGDGVGPIVAIAFVALFLIGFFVAIFVVISAMVKSIQKYSQLKSLRILSSEYIVEDLAPFDEASAPPLGEAGPATTTLATPLLENWALTQAPVPVQMESPSAPPADGDQNRFDTSIYPALDPSVQATLRYEMRNFAGLDNGLRNGEISSNQV